MQCAALQGRLSTTSVFHFGQRQTRPKRDSFLQFGCFSKVSTSKQSNQIEAIGCGIASIWTSPSKTYKNTAFLWVLLINYDNFSGKLTRIVHFCAKMWKKHAFSTCVELMTQCLTTNEYDPSLNCAVCSIARQVEHDQCFHFGQRQTRPTRDSFLQFGCFSKVSTSKQSNQIEAIGYGIASIWTSPSKIYKNTAFLWGLLINYDNFSGKLTRIVHSCTKMCKKPCIFKFVLFKTGRGVQQGWFQTEAGCSDISGNTFYLCVPGCIYIYT